MVIIAIIWTVWLARNRTVLDNIRVLTEIAVNQCVELVKIWAFRAKKKDLSSIKNG